MNRRKFIIASGSVVTMAALYSYSSTLSADLAPKKNKRPKPANFSKPIMKAVAYGITASNPHNTQAWKFKIMSDTSLLLYVDATRILPATDPPTRQIHIGCGCFLETASLGMTQEGFETEVVYFPKGTYKPSEVGSKPVAQLTLTPNPQVKASVLCENLLSRSTSRHTYTNAIIDQSTWQDIAATIGDTTVSLQLMTDPATLTPLLPLLANGMDVEANTYHTHEESRVWFRENDKKIAAQRDGINLPGNGSRGVKKWFAEKQLKGLKEADWHSKKMNDYSLKLHRDRVESSPNLVVLTTATNTLVDWVLAGRTYCRLQLSCLIYDFYMHPLSQVLEEFQEMTEAREAFESAMGVTGTQKIQMVLRVGKSKRPYLSYRRKLDAFMTS